MCGDIEYDCNYHTQDMGNVDYDYLLQSTASSNMTLTMEMAVIGKYDIIIRINIGYYGKYDDFDLII